MLFATHVARPGLLRRRAQTATAALVVSFGLVVPAALFGSASPAAADLSVPNRPSVPLLPAARAHALPGDGSSVRIAMTENDGLDVIMESLGGVSAPGVPDAPAVRFRQTAGTWAVDTGAGCGGPWTQVSTNQTTPTATPVSTSLG